MGLCHLKCRAAQTSGLHAQSQEEEGNTPKESIWIHTYQFLICTRCTQKSARRKEFLLSNYTCIAVSSTMNSTSDSMFRKRTSAISARSLEHPVKRKRELYRTSTTFISTRNIWLEKTNLRIRRGVKQIINYVWHVSICNKYLTDRKVKSPTSIIKENSVRTTSPSTT